MSELKTLSKRLARRKHRRSWFIGISDCGNFGIWRGMLYGNEWQMDIEETKALLRNGARKPV